MIPLVAAALAVAGSAAAATLRQPVSPPPPPGVAEAEEPDPGEFEGYWECLLAQTSHVGNPDETWAFEFLLSLYGDEEFEAEGAYHAMSVGFAEPFYAVGDWWLEVSDDAVWLRLDGTAYLEDFSGPFIFVGENTDWWTIEYEYELQGGSASMANLCYALE